MQEKDFQRYFQPFTKYGILCYSLQYPHIFSLQSRLSKSKRNAQKQRERKSIPSPLKKEKKMLKPKIQKKNEKKRY